MVVQASPGGLSCLRHAVRWCVIGLTMSGALTAWFETSSRHVVVASASTVRAAADPPASAGKVWLVESTAQFDLYSNGLRTENQYAISTSPRRYAALVNGARELRTEPAGIVDHTTESHLAPFEKKDNRWLQRDREGMLEYVQRHRSYHFVIDRFGRVFRIVRERDYANHAGNSVYFGVAFEARSESSGLEATLNAAQIHAGRILTEMLRARYGIGYHQDWAANLPFAELGLGDNYGLALPSMTLFGFARREAAAAVRSSMSRGVDAAETELLASAAAEKLPVERYREKLQERYRDAIRALRGNRA